MMEHKDAVRATRGILYRPPCISPRRRACTVLAQSPLRKRCPPFRVRPPRTIDQERKNKKKRKEDSELRWMPSTIRSNKNDWTNKKIKQGKAHDLPEAGLDQQKERGRTNDEPEIYLLDLKDTDQHTPSTRGRSAQLPPQAPRSLISAAREKLLRGNLRPCLALIRANLHAMGPEKLQNKHAFSVC